MTGQLMEFDFSHKDGGLLKVNYSEKLVTLVKDARVLGEHGFKIPKPVHDVTENAKKFYKEGVTLKQVANFYNSMGTQMIDCQKPMMLEKLQGFEYIIQNPKGGKSGSEQGNVTWNDPIEIEKYIKQVQARATDLIAENRKLRKVHIQVTDMVIELMNIDLLKNRGLWKENLSKMKRIIETVTKSRTAEMSKLWLTHLNYQLYKSLEFQY
jgi:dynein heavy chain 2, cytosolic